MKSFASSTNEPIARSLISSHIAIKRRWVDRSMAFTHRQLAKSPAKAYFIACTWSSDCAGTQTISLPGYFIPLGLRDKCISHTG
jgi:hypothetical protein